MVVYNIVVNDVQKTENTVVCLARIDNYQNMLKHVSIGESITAEPFDINFHNTIGASKWVLIFYPKGQYVPSRNSTVLESGKASMYLKLVACENEDNSLVASVKFFIKSPYFEMKDKFPCTKSATFLYSDLNKRWTGPFDLAPIEKLCSKQCKNFFVNDCLTIGCEVVVTNSSTYIVRSPSYLSNSHSDTDSQKNTNTIRRSNRSVQTDNIEEENKIKPRSKTIMLTRNMVKKEWPYGYPALGESNKKVNSYSFTRNENMGIWDQKLSQPRNEKLEETNNENKLPNLHINTKSKEPKSSRNSQVSDTNSGNVKAVIDFFEKFSLSRN